MHSLWTEYTANKKTKQNFLDAERDLKILSKHYKRGTGGSFHLSGPVQPADREVLIITLKKHVPVQEAEPSNELITLVDDSGAIGGLALKYKLKPPFFRPSGASSPPEVSADMKIIPGRGFAGCGVGDPMKTALDRFGPPEAALRTNVDFYYLEYPSLGLRISASHDKETILGESCFYRSPRDEQFPGMTVDGIDKYSSVQDVFDRYGQPQSDSGYLEAQAQGDFAGSRERRLEYPARGISFVFHNGRLSFFIVYQARGKQA